MKNDQSQSRYSAVSATKSETDVGLPCGIATELSPTRNATRDGVSQRSMRGLRAVALCAFALLLSACSFNNEIALDKATPNAVCEVGDTVKIYMEENPSTGYSWSLDSDPAPTLALKASVYDAPEVGLVGAPGLKSYVFTAKKEGKAQLKFDLKRPWENKVEETLDFSVEVR